MPKLCELNHKIATLSSTIANIAIVLYDNFVNENK